MADLAEREGARTRYVPGLRRATSPTRDALALAQLSAIAREFRPHIVNTHTAKAGFAGRAAALTVRPRPAIVHTYHGHVLEGYFDERRTQAYIALERAMARVSDRLVGVSQSTVDDLVRLGIAPRSKFRAIRLGLDLEPFAVPDPNVRTELRGKIGLGDEDVLLTFVGRAVAIKRLDLLIRAFARARGRFDAMRLAIVGDGEVRLELERLAGELGVRESVYFLGYRRDLPAIAAATDVAVLSSAAEGTPVSLIEAAAAARPAVATDVGGVSEVVTPASGILVPAGDEAAFADALVRLAHDEGARARMGDAARAHVFRRYSVAHLLRATQVLYEELTPGGVVV